MSNRKETVEKPVLAYEVLGKTREKLGWEVDKYIFTKEYRKEFLRNKELLKEATIKEVVDVILKVEAVFRTSPRLNARN